MDTKKCNKCGEYKELECFSIKRRNKDGLDGWCRKCMAEAQKQRYIKNPEYFKKYSKKWRDENKTQHRTNAKNWAMKNAERVAENKRRNVEENADRYAQYYKDYDVNRREVKIEYNKKYYNSNKEIYFRSNARRRAIKKDQMHPDHDLIIEKNLYDIANELCEKYGVKYHVDHIWPLAKGGPHHHDNLQVITGDINQEKNDSVLFKHPDIKTWCDLPDHILKWVKDNKNEKFEKSVKQIVKRNKHTIQEIEKLISI
jgi:hypothetical protein